jgi:indolepyruvate ferredoxin oxidoreductase
VLSYDQLGAAQKWGPVVSSLVIFEPGQAAATSKVGVGQADLYLALDILAAATATNLDRCDPSRTATVVNSAMLPSGEMVRNVRFVPPVASLCDSIARSTRRDRTFFVESRRLAEGLFGDHMMTNTFALGVAYQAGLVPISASAIDAAITLNGVDVHLNLQAFRYGRLWLIEPDRVEALVTSLNPHLRPREPQLEELTRSELAAYRSQLDRCEHLDDETRRLLSIRTAELIRYQDARYSQRYVDFVLSVAEREEYSTPGMHDITQQVARHFYKLLAFKDEYEVARLHTRERFLQEVLGLFEAPRRIVYHLRPPLLQELGLKRKLPFGPGLKSGLTALRAMRKLRGTAFDIFGGFAVRREERRLIEWYRRIIETGLGSLSERTHATIVELAGLPDGIRGYEDIKLQSVAEVRARADELLMALRAPSTH